MAAHIGDYKIEDCARDQRRAQMRWEVVVQEPLSRHQEEREVVARPSDDEEAGGVVQAIANGWRQVRSASVVGKTPAATHGLRSDSDLSDERTGPLRKLQR